jgi:hypothetical protein
MLSSCVIAFCYLHPTFLWLSSIIHRKREEKFFHEPCADSVAVSFVWKCPSGKSPCHQLCPSIHVGNGGITKSFEKNNTLCPSWKQIYVNCFKKPGICIILGNMVYHLHSIHIIYILLYCEITLELSFKNSSFHNFNNLFLWRIIGSHEKY